MKPRHLRRAQAALLICLSFFVAQPGLAGEPTPSADRFQWGGAVELGYRFTDIAGEDRYREVVNLEEGLRLFNFNVWFKDLERTGAADEFRLRVNNIGDPFPSARLDIKKDKVYQLSAYYREFKYFFDREDTPPPFDFVNTLLTDNHDFNQRRRMGTFALSLFPSNEVRLNFGHSFAERTGETGVPRIFTFVPNLTQELDEQYREYFGSIDFPLGAWDFNIKQSFSTYENNDEIDSFPPLVEKRNESIRTYVSTIKTHTGLGDRWDFDAGYVLAHSDGDSHLQTLRTIPIQLDSGDGDVLFDTHIVELGLSHLLRENLVLHFDYRFHTFAQDGSTDTDLFFLPQTVVTTEYSLLANTGTLQVEYAPFDNLTAKAGYRVQDRQIEAENFQANAFDGGTTSSSAGIFAQGWIASANWKPFKSLSLFGEYEGDAFDNPYTRISPQGTSLAKLRVRYETPIKGLNLNSSFLWKRRNNSDQQYRLDVKDYVFAAAYQPPALPQLTLDASYTYESIREEEDILNQEDLISLTPSVFPLSTFFFDSDAQILSGGITLEGIYKGLGSRLAGTVARTRDENSQRYFDATLSFWYKNPWVTPVITFERTYLKDFESPEDSFSANLVTLSLRKEF